MIGIRQIIGARQSADKTGQLRRGGLDHNHRDGSVDFDLGVCLVVSDKVDYRLVLGQSYRLLGKCHHGLLTEVSLLDMNLAIHKNLCF